MNIEDIKNIAVIGAGNMGHQIAMLCAIHGYKTVCTDINAEILKKAENFADTSKKKSTAFCSIASSAPSPVRLSGCWKWAWPDHASPCRHVHAGGCLADSGSA